MESEQTLVFITSNVSAVVRICSGKGCTLYPCTLNILEVVVSQTEINTEVRFGNIRKYISSLPYSSYRTYSLLWQISGYSTASWKRTINDEEPFWNKKSPQSNINLARKNIVGLQGSVSIFTLYLKLGATPSRS